MFVGFNMSGFSNELKQRLIDYFQTKYGQKLTSEQAEAFLLSLANLYSLVVERRAGPQGQPDRRSTCIT